MNKVSCNVFVLLNCDKKIREFFEWDVFEFWMTMNQQANKTLFQHIVDAIIAHNGWITFSHYMNMALYFPHLGYYMNSNTQLGAGGDFVTAPELTPSFAKILAKQIAQLLPHCGNTIYELGAGSGVLARDLLQALAVMGVIPNHYRILEISPSLIQKQQTVLGAYLGKARPLVQWINTLPEQIEGVLLGNELLDAMPCEVVHWTPSQIFHRGVSCNDGQLEWVDKPIKDKSLLALAQQIDPIGDYISEINCSHRTLVADLAKRLIRGAILFIDYGFSQREYYHSQRSHGTLMGHYQQRIVDDPFFRPGQIDLTAHVDFTAIAQTAVMNDLTLIGYTTQANFLINGGILEVLSTLKVASPAYIKETVAVQKLLSIAEMGELFKVIGLGRNIPDNWFCFKKKTAVTSR